MSKTRLSVSDDRTALNIGIPWDPAQVCQFTIPEFHGKHRDRPLAIHQVLSWYTNPAVPDTHEFSLDVPPHELGFDVRGVATLPKPDEVNITLTLANLTETPLQNGHHTFLLTIPNGADLDDADGQHTFFHTDGGWNDLTTLSQRIGVDRHLPIRVGSNFSGTTVIWNVIARVNPLQHHVLALGMTRGYAFASDHPDWSPGLLAGCRWGAIAPGETAECKLRIYLLQGGLDRLHQRFSKDRRER